MGFVHAGEGAQGLERLRAAAVASACASDAAAVAGVLAGCDVLVTWCASDGDAEAVLVRREGLLWRAPPGLTLVDFSPVTPRVMKAIAQRCAADGYRAHGAALSCAGGASRAFVDASVMEDAAALEAVRAVAREMVPTGATGTSKAMALVECLLAGIAWAVSDEAIAIAAGAGIEASVLIPLLLEGSGANRALAGRAGREAAPDHDAIRAGLAISREAAREYRHPAAFGALACALSAPAPESTAQESPHARGKEPAA